MKLIIGLGNPGAQYEKTRHNAGFLCLEYLRKIAGLDSWKEQKKFKAEIAEGHYEGDKIILVRPQTYMNLSGESVSALRSFYKCDLSDIIVLYDDVALPVGTARMRLQGSAGGQKGMKSIIEQLGTEEIARIRIGIESRGEDAKIETKDYVLGRLSNEEESQLLSVFDKISQGLDTILREGTDKGLEIINSK